MSPTNPPSAQAGGPAARDRGDIQRGYSGDKVPGFDPAAAPLETDAEAGGTPQPRTSPGRSDNADRQTDANASSHGSAMRPFEADRKASRSHLPLLIVVLVAAGLLGVALLAAGL